MLLRSDGGDRIELQVAEAPHGVEDGGRRAVEELGADGDAASFFAGDLDAIAEHASTIPRGEPSGKPRVASLPDRAARLKSRPDRVCTTSQIKLATGTTYAFVSGWPLESHTTRSGTNIRRIPSTSWAVPF